jgi:hypothetical protein
MGKHYNKVSEYVQSCDHYKFKSGEKGMFYTVGKDN